MLDAPVLATKPVRAVVMPVAPVDGCPGRRAPVVAPPVAEIRAAPVGAAPRAAAGSKAQGRVHAAARRGSSSEASPRLRRDRPLGAATGDRRARPAARHDARTRTRWPTAHRAKRAWS